MASNLINVNPQMQQLAESAVDAAKDKFGVSLDFSENSLQQLDTLLLQAHEGYKKTSSGGNPVNISIENTVRIWGSYFGEVIRHSLGGDWIIDQNNVFLELDSRKVDPLGQVRSLIVGEFVQNIQSYFREQKIKTQNKLAAELIDHETNIKISTQNTRSHRSCIILASICGFIVLCSFSLIGFWVLNRQGILSIPSQINFQSFFSTPTSTAIPLSRQYSQEVSPAIDQLGQWDADFYNAFGDINVFILGYNRFMSLPGAEFIEDPNKAGALREYNRIEGNGESILDVFALETPPLEVQSAHEEVVSCIKIRIQLLQIISFAMAHQQLIYTSTISDPNACLTYDTAFEKIVAYVKANK